MDAAVERTGTCRRTYRALDPTCAAGPSTRERLESGRGSCEQSGVHQSVADIAVVENNRCLRISAPCAWSGAVRRQSSELAGTDSGTIDGTVGGRVSRDLVYT